MEMNILDGASIAVAIIGLGLGAYFDLFNRRNIPDAVTIPFLIIGILIAIVRGFPLEMWLVGLCILLGGYVSYRLGYIGGADVLYVGGLFFLLPFHPFKKEQTLFFLSLLVLAGVFFALYFFLYYLVRVIRERVMPDPIKAIVGILIGVGYAVVLRLLLELVPITTVALASLAILVVSSIFFYIYREKVNDWMTEMVPYEKVEEEDVLAIEKMDPEIVKKNQLGRLIDHQQWQKMRKLGEEGIVNAYPVYTQMPFFLPFLFISLVLHLLLGTAMLLPY